MRRLKLVMIAATALAAGGLFVPGAARAELVRIQLEEPRAMVEGGRAQTAPGEIPQWIADVGRLYMEQDGKQPPDPLLEILEAHMGIKATGHLELVQSWKAAQDLALADIAAGNCPGVDASWIIYLKEAFSLTGFNYLYFETCMRHRATHGDRLVRYFETGFYPNMALFSATSHYYKSLYYYLLMVTDDLFKNFSRATTLLRRDPGANPDFISEEQIRRFAIATHVATELDGFVASDLGADMPLSGQIFSKDQLAWLRETIAGYTSIDTHSALMSFEWFRTRMPYAISADAISHTIGRTWRDQTAAFRTRLPLMFFVDQGEASVSIESLFGATVEKLRIDNRAVDMVVMTALETWLSKQVKHGIRIDDRLLYNTILAELKVCPTGWIFANLYDCRTDLAALKAYADGWDGQARPGATFQAGVMDSFFAAKEKIDRVFGDLEKIFGKAHAEERANYIFHKYRGEIHYYFKYIEFETFKGKGPMITAAGPEDNFLTDFRIALVKEPENPQNHINLLNAYHLLFRKLFAAGRVRDMQKREAEMETFIRGRYRLGAMLSHRDNNLYDIYRVLTYAYLSSTTLESRALETARLGFELARDYYAKAAQHAGFVVAGQTGAITRDNTEMDDYQRQFELYGDVARRLGKRIQLLVPEADIQLYNRMQAMRSMERYTP
ncbi:MAG: hypothetical protein SWC96_03315 [Thermodesulfobacteriota bacterium]|nr:hypothetical protein [Thermodesulfobacteriota bacterium]